MRRALIVVDLQNDFCPGGALAVPGGDEVVDVANELLAEIPLSVLTQDWHPGGHVSFASSYDRQAYELDDSVDPPRVLWPDHCVAGSPGADFHPALKTERAKLIIRKGFSLNLDSYSAFFENDGITPTGLAGWLSSLGVGSVVVMGLATDYCVKATALDARKLGLEVSIVAEGVRAVNARPGDGDAALKIMEEAGCKIITLREMLV
ncbi:MAG: bifunctional nicotinamidase/pyrazinamidase [Spirochaetia bacterium]|jgi:nicotinamidase/pyrazinamidase|uniref:Nicotinamidase n=2 Tax=root TaxID=1 RepID=A0A652ZY00_9SPIR|nr:bifunctional nicotinamidase/pyrazinamidase [Spirochaetia bacterium]MCE1208679.1 bifunctional nicotinamidase/pyrazinamidase [Spirochaetia bacterium]NLX45262.1 bifunctional nicotinamidase/pyrazinamidase [Treponema sp.]VBB40652.1 Pyrazinamidase/nicotinamidase [uncultured Spirochaetota bacterium]